MKWISVEDKMPPVYESYGHGDEVLVTNGKSKWLDIYQGNGMWIEHSLWNMKMKITHWMTIELPGQI